MSYVALLLEFLKNHQDVLWSAIGTLLAISVAKLPDPRKFEGKSWHYFYDVFFAFASRASALEWDKLGGRFKLPGFQVPALKEVPHPKDDAR